MDSEAEQVLPFWIIQATKRISEAVKNCPKKKEIECCLCKKDFPICTVKDLFEIYGAIIFCVKAHANKLIVDSFDVFIVEVFLLNIVSYEKYYSVQKTLSRIKEDNLEQLLTDKFVSYYQEYAKEPIVKFFIHQPINCLLFEIYDHLFPVQLNILLFLLFLRKETKRFLDLFNEMHIKTLPTYKMALILLLEEDKDELRDELENRVIDNFEDLNFNMKKYKPMNFDPFSFFIDKCNVEEYPLLKEYLEQASKLPDPPEIVPPEDDFIMPLKEDIDQIFQQCMEQATGTIKKEEEKVEVLLPEPLDSLKEEIFGVKFFKKYKLIDFNQRIVVPKDFSAWFKRINEIFDWQFCIKMWESNRTKDLYCVDSAMIEVCLKQNKYEEGWLIYSDYETAKDGCLVVITNLCLLALIRTNNDIWIERIKEVIDLAVKKGLKSICCEIITEAVKFICSLSDENRAELLHLIAHTFYSLTESDELIYCVLENLLRICSKCKSTLTCTICSDYAYKYYLVWKDHTKGFFFNKKTQYDADIICAMLCVCTETLNKKVFYKVCQDIFKYKVEMDYETRKRLEVFHEKEHKNCDFERSCMRETKKFVKHFLECKEID